MATSKQEEAAGGTSPRPGKRKAPGSPVLRQRRAGVLVRAQRMMCR
jgi:hypothetical protein